MSTNGATGLTVIICGAGIAGLAAATGLAKKGHNVIVLEDKPALNEFGASIGILSNGVRPLRAWGLEEEFAAVVTKNIYLEIREGHTNTSIGYLPHNKNNHASITYGEEVWNINRKDYQEVLARAAESSGAKLLFGAKTVSVDVEECCVTLEDGRQMKADVIVGADGMRSVVRRFIPALAHVEPVALKEKCFRCTVPKDRMRGNPKIEWLLKNENEMCWSVPGRYVLSWPLIESRPYDVVLCEQTDSDVPAGRWGIKAEPQEGQQIFGDFCPEVTELLSNMDACIKWTLAELPPMETFCSENGKVILIGDAAHAQIPHTASGGNSAIEDAACISECLDWAFRNKKDLVEAAKAYESVQKPRVERMQTASHEGYDFLGATADFLLVRNKALAAQTALYEEKLALPEEVRRAEPKATGDMHARFPSAPYLQWLHAYDAIAATREHLSKLG